jgi:hypothetical protein
MPRADDLTNNLLYFPGPSRCFPFWQELLGCYVVNGGEGEAGKKKCVPALEDYYECLHHTKEVCGVFEVTAIRLPSLNIRQQARCLSTPVSDIRKRSGHPNEENAGCLPQGRGGAPTRKCAKGRADPESRITWEGGGHSRRSGFLSEVESGDTWHDSWDRLRAGPFGSLSAALYRNDIAIHFEFDTSDIHPDSNDSSIIHVLPMSFESSTATFLALLFCTIRSVVLQ